MCTIRSYSIFLYSNLDIDECNNKESVCHRLANCTNTEGSYICHCPKKYPGDGVNECSLADNTCEEFPCLIGMKCSEKLNRTDRCENCNTSFFKANGDQCVRNKIKSKIFQQMT